jgi:hypothetical protein
VICVDHRAPPLLAEECGCRKRAVHHYILANVYLLYRGRASTTNCKRYDRRDHTSSTSKQGRCGITAPVGVRTPPGGTRYLRGIVLMSSLVCLQRDHIFRACASVRIERPATTNKRKRPTTKQPRKLLPFIPDDNTPTPTTNSDTHARFYPNTSAPP